MESGAATVIGGPGPKATWSRSARLGIVGATAAVIAAVAFLASLPPAGTNSVTSVTVPGDARGEPPAVGRAAPDFLATTVDGEPVRLSDFRGRPVWLTFGASWCQPCRAENPDIQAMAEKFAADGLVVLAVFISEDASTVTDYVDRVGLTYRTIADPGARIAAQYRIVGIASHEFIDRSGVLRMIRVGSLDPTGMESALLTILD